MGIKMGIMRWLTYIQSSKVGLPKFSQRKSKDYLVEAFRIDDMRYKINDKKSRFL